MGLAAAASGQEGPMWWASTHADHHRHCEEVGADPHTPTAAGGGCFGVLYAHVLWMTRQKHMLIHLDNVRRHRRAPELFLCDVFAREASEACRLLLHLLVQLGLGLVLDESGHGDAVAALVLAAFALSLNATALINSWCHSWSASDKCSALDVRWVGLLNGGEGYHKSHHDDPACAYHGAYLGAFDMTYCCICALEKLRLISNVRHAHTKLHRD